MKARTSLCFVFKGKSEILTSPEEICREVSKTSSHTSFTAPHCHSKTALVLTSYILNLVGVLTSVGPAKDNNAK